MDITSPRLKKIWASLLIPVAILLLTMPAWLPFLRTSSLPCTHDNAFHYFRITAMRDALRHGWLFSRWIPNLALGYGYPFFNYREPLPYLVGEILYTLGLPLPLVLGSFYAFSIILAALGSYVLSRDLFGRRAAWVGAVSYGMAPYVLLDAFRRGNLPESVALAILPWIFVFFRRLIIGGDKNDFVKSTALLIALFLSHNITSLLLVPFLAGFVLYYACLYRTNKKWHWAFVAVAIAVLLTAWFWLPALFEQDMVQLNLSHTTRNNDFHYNFISWKQIFLEPLRSYDENYLNPPMKVTLGIGQGILTLVGIIMAFIFRRTREQRGVILIFVIFTLLYLWMSTPDSAFIWEVIPPMAFVQFPWRLVGRALLPVSMLSASAFMSRSRRRSGHREERNDRSHSRRHANNTQAWQLSTYSYLKTVFPVTLLCAAIAFLILSAYPRTYPPKGTCALVPYPDIADVTAYEKQGWLGMDPEQSYFPVWVEEHPSESSLADAFTAGNLPHRLDLGSLPQDSVVSADYRVLSAFLHLRSPQAFQARWKGLYFPGWQVRIDGELVPITPEADTGLITFLVPAGDHQITLRFGSTPLRSLGIALMCVGVVVLITLFVINPFHSSQYYSRYSRHTATVAGSYIIVLAIILLLVRFVAAEYFETPINHSRVAGRRLPEVTTSVYQTYDDHIDLAGYTIPSGVIQADAEIQFDLLWRARGNPQKEYHTTILVMGPDGQAWSPAGTLRPIGYETPPPTTMWETGNYVYDPHIVSLLPGTPPGIYHLDVVIFDKQTLRPLSLVNSDGSLGQPSYRLGSIEVTRPDVPFSLKSLGVGEETEAQTCDSYRLWSMTLDRADAAPGDIVAVRWVWEMLQTGGDDSDAVLTLVDSDNRIVESWHLPLSGVWWPVQNWNTAERWVGRHVIRLPNQIEGGHYRVNVSLGGCDTSLASVALNIADIVREWEIPGHFTKVKTSFSSQITLVGYDLPQEDFSPGDTVTLGLSWQAVKEVGKSYRVFLHLVDSEGRVVDQDDGEPANWKRPTTGWLQDEVVTEARELTIPETTSAEDYTINVGLYTQDGTRLLLPSGEDTYTLTRIQVGNE